MSKRVQNAKRQQKNKQIKNKQTKRKPQKKSRAKKVNFKIKLRTISVAFVLFFLLLGGVIYFLQSKHKDEYNRYVIQQLYNRGHIEKIITPNRGLITDRHGNTLAASETIYKVIFDVKLLRNDISETNREETLKQLPAIMGMTEEELLEIYNNPKNANTHYLIIGEPLNREMANVLTSKNLKGVFLEETSKRNYPNNTVGADFIGFLRGNDSWGIEKYYNDYIAGEEGRTYKYATSLLENGTRYIQAKQGDSITTTIDLNMQKFAEETLYAIGEEYAPKSATIIITNPFTGEILTHAQYPTYDLNAPDNLNLMIDFNENFNNISDDDKVAYLNNIWKDGAIYDTFEPGSIYKPLVVAAALEEGVIKESDVFHCSGSKRIGDEEIPCSNTGGHGTQNLEQALANSCNPAMMEIIYKLGVEKYYEYQREYGFGERTDIDLPYEVSGANLLHTMSQLSYGTYLATNSMGQGFNVTAIQMMMGFGATINGGNLMKPYMVSKITDKENAVVFKNEPTVVRKIVSNEVSDSVRMMLKSVISPQGTGSRAIIEGYELGGKTGTAQQGARDEGNNAYSLIGYLSAKNPDILISLTINQPQIATEYTPTPAYAFRDLALKIIKYKNIPPSSESEIGDLVLYNDATFEMQDLTGMTAQEASKILYDLGIDFEYCDSGNRISSHYPAAGDKIAKSTKVFLYLKSDGQEELLEPINTKKYNMTYARELLTEQGFITVFTEATHAEMLTLTEEELTELNIDIESIKKEAERVGNGETGNPNGNGDTEPRVVFQMPEKDKYLPRGTIIKLKVF